MEVKITKKRELIVKHILKKNETFRIQSGKFNSVSIFKKPQWVNGISSYCEDGKHVLFCDWDNCPLWLVEQDWKNIQKKYRLCQAYLFSTKEEKDELGEVVGSYHIICLVKNYPKSVYKILSETHVDSNFVSMPMRKPYKNWTLRISTKSRKGRPKFIKIIGEKINLTREISKPHLEFLRRVYDLPTINYKNFDKNNTKIFLQQYETS